MRYGDRQQQQRGGKDWRNDARGIELQGQMRGVALEDAVAHLLPGVLDRQPALGALDEDNGGDHSKHQRQQGDHLQPGGRSLARQLEQTGKSTE
jgi:hypothetical protein